MIKKILLTLLILIILVVIGIVSLVVFVDPNNFRGFISETVKDKTGYELTIEGDLRWHVWPQISILTDSIRLEDEGAKTPILTADNMRLDVELLPLFSKELAVKNVLVKSAVINITDAAKGKVAKGSKSTTTVNQTQTDQPKSEQTDSSWSFTLNKLDIVDSTVIYQQDKDIISFRDIDIAVVQKDNKSISVQLSGSVNRDQQDLGYSLDADINLANFPQSANVVLHKLAYDYKGVGIPTGQLKGEVSAIFNYQKTPFILDSKDFTLTLNGNVIKGQLKANLDKKPYFEALFNSDKFDLTPFLVASPEDKNNHTEQSPQQSQPVVSSKIVKGNELAFLTGFDAKFKLTVKEVIANNVVINNVEIDANNKDGIATLNKVNLDVAKGHITASGAANGKQATTSIKLATKASDIELGMLFAQLDLINNFKGQFNADGHIATNTIVADNIMRNLTGELAVIVNNARFENFNIQGIMQAAISQYSKESISSQEYQKYTELHEISANAKLANGDMELSSIRALSATLDVIGSGHINLLKQDLDVELQAKILSGWNEESKTIQQLQKIAIPLHIYGPFNGLHYQVDAEKIIKDVLNNKLQNRLDKLNDRLGGEHQSNDNTNDQHNSKKSKVKDVLGGLLNHIKQGDN